MERESQNIGRQIIFVFALALIGYGLLYSCDSHLRTRKGVWQTRFIATNSDPRIEINESTLGISNVTLIFMGETVTNQNDRLVVFDHPEKPIPFGKVKFEDLTYLPGSVAFDFFGHEVELLPRTLYINKVERGWKSNSEIVLKPTEKLPPERFNDKRNKKKLW